MTSRVVVDATAAVRVSTIGLSPETVIDSARAPTLSTTLRSTVAPVTTRSSSV
jgi:hypothetical protein